MPQETQIVENDTQEYHNRVHYGYESNKDIPISKIDKIEIEKFRSLSDREIKLGKYLTIISGKNGTMKTTLMGLIAHPFSNDNEDAFHDPLKLSKVMFLDCLQNMIMNIVMISVLLQQKMKK